MTYAELMEEQKRLSSIVPDAVLITTSQSLFFAAGTVLKVSYMFDSTTRTTEKFQIDCHFKVNSWSQSVDELLFHKHLYNLVSTYFLQFISKEFRLRAIEGQSLAPESKIVYFRCPIRFSRGFSAGPLAAASFRFDLFFDKMSKISTFNIKGVTNDYRLFDQDPTSDVYQTVNQIESFFVNAHPLFIESPNEQPVEVCSIQYVKVLKNEKEKKVVLPGKKMVKKPLKIHFKKPATKTALIALAKGFTK